LNPIHPKSEVRIIDIGNGSGVAEVPGRKETIRIKRREVSNPVLDHVVATNFDDS